ncbi:MAG: hypothetical protein J7575_03425, partial [Chloroflexi bacterium]|nr:hypothetical protein [Chloroflexota bacterium]
GFSGLWASAPGTILRDLTAATGLRVASVVRCGKLMTLDRTLLTGRLGMFSDRLMMDVDVRLKKALGLR